MFGFCWHKWHIIRSYTDSTLRAAAWNPGYDPDSDLDDYISPLPFSGNYAEKVCLKCERYIDEVTPRFEHHRKKFLEYTQMRSRTKQILSKLGRSKKAWEELLSHD